MTSADVISGMKVSAPQIGAAWTHAPHNSIQARLTIHSKSGDDLACEARIWSASDGFLRLIIAPPVAPGDNALVQFEGCETHGEVAFCQEAPGGYNVGIQLLNDLPTRREPRFPIRLPGTLTVLGDEGPRHIGVDLVDVSASGVGMVSSKPVAVGSCVEINLAIGVLFGEIRHCEITEGGPFRVGVKMYHMINRESPADRSRAGHNFLSWLKRTKTDPV